MERFSVHSVTGYDHIWTRETTSYMILDAANCYSVVAYFKAGVNGRPTRMTRLMRAITECERLNATAGVC